LKVAIVCKHATLHFMHVSPACISQTGLMSKWCSGKPQCFGHSFGHLKSRTSPEMWSYIGRPEL